MAVGLIYHEAFLKHETGPTHPERPARLRAIMDRMAASGRLAALTELPFDAALPETLGVLHAPQYINRVRDACELGADHMDSLDTPICPASFESALLAVGGVRRAADAVMAGEVASAFCALRPPGHHAEKRMAMGFCLFANIALAAEHLVREHGLERVAILDFDVHHGNGTQHLFEERADVLFLSSHEHPRFQFPGTGFEHENGYGEGVGVTMNVPLLPGTGDDAFRNAYTQKLLPKLDSYRPQFILVSAGFDAHAADPLGGLDVTFEAFDWLTQQIIDAARRHCDGRIVSVLEGGYDLQALGECVDRHVGVLLANMT